MIITNTQNRIKKEVQINDTVYIGFDLFKIIGETAKSWRLEYIGLNPNVKKKETYNKSTFAKRFFFDGKNNEWCLVIKGRVPNLDYM